MTVESADSVRPEDSELRPEPRRGDSVESSEQDESHSHFWLTDRDQWLVAAVTLLAVVLLGVKYVRLGYVDRSAVVLERQTDGIGYRIDLNSASWIELTQLRGIGATYARRIVEDREANGPFTSIDDLQRVHGIGPKTVEKNRQWMRIGDASDADAASRQPTSTDSAD